MRLFPGEHERLALIDGTLRADAPRLAAKYDMFTRLARDEGEPPSEQRFRASGGRRPGIVAWWRRGIRFLASSWLRRSQYAGIPR